MQKLNLYGEVFQKSNHDNVLDFVKDARNETNKKRLEWMSFKFKNNMNNRTIQKVNGILGFNVSDYQIVINGETQHHIDSRHGINGEHDKTMSDDNNYLDIQKVIESPDDVEPCKDDKGNNVYDKHYRNSDNTPAIVLEFKKKYKWHTPYCYCLS